MKHLLIIALVGLCLSGCNSTPKSSQYTSIPANVLVDDLLLDKALVATLETENEVFTVTEAMQQDVEAHLARIENPSKRVRSLLEFIFNHTEQGLIYNNTANFTASQTYENRSANCLSLSIMTYALAKHADMQVTFQEIDIPEFWTHREGHSLLNGHINVMVYPQQKKETIYTSEGGYEIDFDPYSPKQRFPKYRASKQHVLAMFYNNKGADALIVKDYAAAYAYFRQAMLVAPDFSSSYTNMGVLLRMHSMFEQAENAYAHAIALTKNNNTAWNNLAILYAHQNKDIEAQQIFDELYQKRRRNPYYHHTLGNEAFAKGNYKKAISYYKKALQLNNAEHEFYFGLAKAYYELGNYKASKRNLKLARRHTKTNIIARNYQAKLNVLNAQH